MSSNRNIPSATSVNFNNPEVLAHCIDAVAHSCHRRHRQSFDVENELFRFGGDTRRHIRRVEGRVHTLERSSNDRADFLDRQLRETHQEVRQLRQEIREAHNLIRTLSHARDLHHRRLISIEHRLGLRLVPRLPRNIQNPDSLVHQPDQGPSASSSFVPPPLPTSNVSIRSASRIRSPVSPSVAARILLPASATSSSSDTLYSDHNPSSSSTSEHILPVFASVSLLDRIDLTEGDESNPITLE